MKKSKKIIIIIPIMIVAGLVVTSLIYFWSTMSALDCKNYCIEHTARNATKFTRIGDGRYVDDYAYWIASNGDSKRAQEIFIFKRKSLGMFHFDRMDGKSGTLNNIALSRGKRPAQFNSLREKITVRKKPVPLCCFLAQGQIQILSDTNTP